MTQFAEIDGARIAFDTTGSGPDVVLVHAGVTDRHMWDEIVPMLEAEFRVTRYDMRGFGETTEDGEPTWAPRTDLIGVMDAAGIESAVVIGVSMGGGAAINAALEYPDRISALIAVNPGLGGFEYQPDDWETAIEEQMEAALDAEEWDECARLDTQMWLAGPHRQVTDMDPELVHRMREWLLVSYKSNPFSRAIRMARPANDRLHEIEIPVLAVLGDLDVASMPPVIDRIAGQTPNGSSVTIEGTAHLPPLENPQAFMAAIRGFLTTEAT